jgi:hypothetical protein
MNHKRTTHIVLYVLALLATLPQALAARSGIPGLDNAIALISGIFYPSVLLQNETVQVGFFKFMYFILIFATINWALNKFVFNKGNNDANGKRTSGVAAFAISGISAWFMPVRTALGVGGFITALFTLLIPVGIAFLAVYVAFWHFKDEWWKHLIGLLLIIIAITMISWLVGVIA